VVVKDVVRKWSFAAEFQRRSAMSLPRMCLDAVACGGKRHPLSMSQVKAGHCKYYLSEYTHAILYIESLLPVNISEIPEN
jgi:hypothetical protein